ncbi:cysteine desulfurase family protein [Persephonella sp.]
MIYFDNASTTKTIPKISKNIGLWMEEFFGNPNSIHSDGQKSRRVIENVRMYISSLLNVESEEIIFTSCATESNNTIIRGLYESYPEKNEVIVSPIEHKSVINPIRYLSKKGVKVHFLKVNNEGIVDIDDLKRKISNKTLFVSVIHVNNETGVIQDIEGIGKICKDYNIPFFSDTVQSFCKINIPIEYVDFLSVSGHKINAPKGIGFLRRNSNLKISPLLYGGGQEFGIRSGTENPVSILALSESIKFWDKEGESLINKLTELSNKFIYGLLEIIPEVKIINKDSKRIPNIVNVIFPKIKGHTMVMALNSEGIEVSSGSACSSGSPSPSDVLLAYGLSEEEALRSVRFSFGIFNTEDEVEICLEKIKTVYSRLKSLTDFF